MRREPLTLPRRRWRPPLWGGGREKTKRPESRAPARQPPTWTQGPLPGPPKPVLLPTLRLPLPQRGEEVLPQGCSPLFLQTPPRMPRHGPTLAPEPPPEPEPEPEPKPRPTSGATLRLPLPPP